VVMVNETDRNDVWLSSARRKNLVTLCNEKGGLQTVITPQSLSDFQDYVLRR